MAPQLPAAAHTRRRVKRRLLKAGDRVIKRRGERQQQTRRLVKACRHLCFHPPPGPQRTADPPPPTPPKRSRNSTGDSRSPSSFPATPLRGRNLRGFRATCESAQPSIGIQSRVRGAAPGEQRCTLSRSSQLKHKLEVSSGCRATPARRRWAAALGNKRSDLE